MNPSILSITAATAARFPGLEDTSLAQIPISEVVAFVLSQARKPRRKAKKPRVIVEVKGGVVQAVHSNTRINCDVLDRDNADCGGQSEDEANRDTALDKEIDSLRYSQ